MPDSNEDNQREYFRYNADENALVKIEARNDQHIVGLMRDESYQGFAAVFQKTAFRYTEGDTVEVEAGRLPLRTAEVIWIKSLDEKFLKIGFEWKDD